MIWCLPNTFLLQALGLFSVLLDATLFLKQISIFCKNCFAVRFHRGLVVCKTRLRQTGELVMAEITFIFHSSQTHTQDVACCVKLARIPALSLPVCGEVLPTQLLRKSSWTLNNTCMYLNMWTYKHAPINVDVKRCRCRSRLKYAERELMVFLSRSHADLSKFSVSKPFNKHKSWEVITCNLNYLHNLLTCLFLPAEMDSLVAHLPPFVL